LLGPLEEEEEGTGITSDVVKVKGEDQDPDTPGYLRGDRVKLGRENSTQKSSETSETKSCFRSNCENPTPKSCETKNCCSVGFKCL